MKKAIHLMRSMRTTWCGRKKPLLGKGLATTGRREGATCKVCLKADTAEHARNV